MTGLIQRFRNRRADRQRLALDRVAWKARLLSERWTVSVCISECGDTLVEVVRPFGCPYSLDEPFGIGSSIILPWEPADCRARRRAEEIMRSGVWDGSTLIPPSRIRDIIIEKAEDAS